MLEVDQMKNLIDSKIDFYKEITMGTKTHITDELNKNGISILDGFIKNEKLVKEFYDEFYQGNYSRIVLCGINPGRLGAGKTGVPFLDYKSLSKMLNNVNINDRERSAQFIFSLISKVGMEHFFKNVYLTNVSWFGFIKDQKNYNYHQLNPQLQNEFIQGFVDEMDVVKPIAIVPLSEEVENTLTILNKRNPLKWKITRRLPHPYYCSFKSRSEDALNEYMNVINEWTKVS